ncbi:hypothetical protein TNCV_3499321 [Trichonephila clavipes]|nr:hypothetical protein TNCV_3499321 [Trichonephila clavipes]
MERVRKCSLYIIAGHDPLGLSSVIQRCDSSKAIWTPWQRIKCLGVPLGIDRDVQLLKSSNSGLCMWNDNS